jgi:hypothetical protein
VSVHFRKSCQLFQIRSQTRPDMSRKNSLPEWSRVFSTCLLDDILRYEIRPNTTLANRPLSVKMSTTPTMVMFAVGLINSVLSLMTFQSKDSRTVGCGIYLLTSSITSLLTITMFTIKFWFLILTQINVFVSRSVLRGGCILIDPLLKYML